MEIKSTRSTWGTVIITIFLGLIACFMALPLVYTVTLAFKPIDELFVFPPKFLVLNPTFKNFRDLFALLNNSYVPLNRYIFNSLFISIVGTVGHIIIASMAAYPFAKRKFPGSKFMFSLIVYSLLFSGYVTSIPRFVILSKLGWMDKYISIIFPAFASSLGLYLMKQFMVQIPDSIIEAASIDGASEFKIFSRIVMPNVKSAWLTLGLLSFQGLWGNSADVSLYIHNESLKTLPLALSYVAGGGIARVGATAVTSLIMILPPIIIFIICQSNVIETMKSSGMKD
jgi:putative chitobiose transport system permease protein